jgi:hypothetical protein
MSFPEMSPVAASIKFMFDLEQSGPDPGSTLTVPSDGDPAPVPLERLEAQICELADVSAEASAAGQPLTSSSLADALLVIAEAFLGEKVAVNTRLFETDIRDQPDSVGAPTRRHRRCSTRVVSTGLMTMYAVGWSLAVWGLGSAELRAVRSVP